MEWFESRELKKEIVSLDEKIDQSKRELVSAQVAKNDSDVKIESLKSELAKVKKEAAKTAKLVREQTGADLLVNALRELGVIPPEKEGKKVDHFSQADILNRQMAAAQSQSSQFGGYGQRSSLGNLIGAGFH